MTTAPRPGWYPDPAGGDQLFRWWDGQAWTEATSRAPLPPRPDPGQPPGAPSARASSTVRLTIVLASGFTLFVIAALGVGGMLWHQPESPASSRAAPAPSVAGVPGNPLGRLDESTRVASIGPAALTLPGPPYELYDDPVSVAGFDAFFVANAPVHERYDGKHTWSAAVGMAHLDPTSSAVPGLQQACPSVLHQLSRQMFDGHRTTVGPVTVVEHKVDGHPGALATAQVRYLVDGLPSRYDQVTALVVQLDDGSYVVAISSIPNDSSPSVSRLAARSLESLRIS